jgi:hypothetical protein
MVCIYRVNPFPLPEVGAKDRENEMPATAAAEEAKRAAAQDKLRQSRLARADSRVWRARCDLVYSVLHERAEQGLPCPTSTEWQIYWSIPYKKVAPIFHDLVAAGRITFIKSRPDRPRIVTILATGKQTTV